MKHYYCPSMMCADFTKLAQEVKDLDAAGADLYHMDVMDGTLVPNFALGAEDFKAIRAMTKTPMDVHLMVVNPRRYLKFFADLGANIIYIHYESELNPIRSLMMLKELGVHPGLVVSPDISFETVQPALPYVDDVLVMTVNPGFAGQPYLQSVEPKLQQLIAHRDEFGYRIFIDGAMAPDKIHRLETMGADGFILGTSTLFGKKQSYAEILSGLAQSELQA